LPFARLGGYIVSGSFDSCICWSSELTGGIVGLINTGLSLVTLSPSIYKQIIAEIIRWIDILAKLDAALGSTKSLFYSNNGT
jgi:hypothetical protein